APSAGVESIVPVRKSAWRWSFVALPLLALGGAGFFWLYQPRKVVPFTNVTVGNEFVAGIDEDGFHAQQYDPQGQPFRWTNGSARLVIPIDARNPPRMVRLHLLPWRPPQVEPPALRITVNQQELFREKVAKDQWHRTFDLSGLN